MFDNFSIVLLIFDPGPIRKNHSSSFNDQSAEKRHNGVSPKSPPFFQIHSSKSRPQTVIEREMQEAEVIEYDDLLRSVENFQVKHLLSQLEPHLDLNRVSTTKLRKFIDLKEIRTAKLFY